MLDTASVIPRLVWLATLARWSLIFFPGFLLFYWGLTFWLSPIMKVVYARWPWLTADYRRRRINARELCPACLFSGRKDMKFDSVGKMVVLQCPRCQACWAHAPAVNAAAFARPIEEE